MIVFQSVILQRTQGVNISTQIFKRIHILLNFWNHGAFDKLMKDMYDPDMGYLLKAHRNQTEEKHHITFSNLVLKGKSRKAVRLVCDREKGRVFKPD